MQVDALIVETSPHDVPATVERIRAGLDRRGVALFAVVDHAGAARDAGLELADEVVLIFGNPAVGTGLMQADPRVGIELPLRILVWAGADATRVAFRDPRALVAGYDLTEAQDTLARLRVLLDQLVAEAVAPAT
ncbi:DUF302 domain-containing protein [Pseudonocardia xinjiangensis]|uniref:DUF302 domain-containing protein n=1 Tax=Pseudonocardia xinjiangensis TaxID=75289 RepID=A0ABX1RD89_9PSEU|nr:DUF302 domain-containing protein [Pseudonocardia xinjiangensis]NMH77090.1 DUF302 domain-containing protein [Pseudonocardia xinjiangensis]